MIISMTGFGKCSNLYNQKKITVELRSLNSKQVDMNMRLPSIYREKEGEFRNLISKSIERGKIDVSVNYELAGQSQSAAINKTLLLAFIAEMKAIHAESGLNTNPDFFGLALKMPEVLQTEKEALADEEWKVLQQTFTEALAQLQAFRLQEGQALQADLQQRLNNIGTNRQKIAELMPERKEAVKTKLKKALDELLEKNNFDANRFEQELIYYLEKLDVTEELVRLNNHLSYFNETILLPTNEGRKLGFIAQEIGREINTIGSKCNDADIQRLVVEMKDELEKIKEQVLNVI